MYQQYSCVGKGLPQWVECSRGRIHQAPACWGRWVVWHQGASPGRVFGWSRLFPHGKPQLPSVLGSAGWFRHQGESPGCVDSCCTGCQVVAIHPPTPPTPPLFPLPVRDKVPQSTDVVTYGFPLPHRPFQVEAHLAQTAKATCRSSLPRMQSLPVDPHRNKLERKYLRWERHAFGFACAVFLGGGDGWATGGI